MSCTCLIAGFIADAMLAMRRKFATWVRAKFVDTAFHGFADLADQCDTTRW